MSAVRASAALPALVPEKKRRREPESPFDEAGAQKAHAPLALILAATSEEELPAPPLKPVEQRINLLYRTEAERIAKSARTLLKQASAAEEEETLFASESLDDDGSPIEERESALGGIKNVPGFGPARKTAEQYREEVRCMDLTAADGHFRSLVSNLMHHTIPEPLAGALIDLIPSFVERVEKMREIASSEHDEKCAAYKMQIQEYKEVVRAWRKQQIRLCA